MSDISSRGDEHLPADDLEKVIDQIVERSNRKASLQPEYVRKAMQSFFEFDDGEKKPWETWL